MTDADDRLLVRALCEIEDGLNEWEQEFVESVSKQVLDQHRPLTDRQRSKAETILEDKGS